MYRGKTVKLDTYGRSLEELIDVFKTRGNYIEKDFVETVKEAAAGSEGAPEYEEEEKQVKKAVRFCLER